MGNGTIHPDDREPLNELFKQAPQTPEEAYWAGVMQRYEKRMNELRGDGDPSQRITNELHEDNLTWLRKAAGNDSLAASVFAPPPYENDPPGIADLANVERWAAKHEAVKQYYPKVFEDGYQAVMKELTKDYESAYRRYQETGNDRELIILNRQMDRMGVIKGRPLHDKDKRPGLPNYLGSIHDEASVAQQRWSNSVVRGRQEFLDDLTRELILRNAKGPLEEASLQGIDFKNPDIKLASLEEGVNAPLTKDERPKASPSYDIV